MTNHQEIKVGLKHNLAFSLDEIITRAFHAVIIINADQQIIYFNRGVEHTFGYTTEDADVGEASVFIQSIGI